MKTLVFAILLINAQIMTCNAGSNNLLINDYEEKYPGNMGPETKRFIGSFQLDKQPSPGAHVLVRFNLIATGKNASGSAEKDEWLIGLDYPDNAIEISSNSLFKWLGSHVKGETFSGEFEFVPIMSGNWAMSLYLFKVNGNKIPLRHNSGIAFNYCIDEDGQLHYLSNIIYDNPKCTGIIKSYFLYEDSLIIKQRANTSRVNGFEYSVEYKSLPVIGDTCTVIYKLKANMNFPHGIDMTIHATSIAIISPPDPVGYSITTGSEIEIPIRVKPLAVRNNHSLELDIGYNDSPYGNQTNQSIWHHYIFDEEGHLKYINDKGFLSVPEDRYPQNYPKADYKRDLSIIRVSANGAVEFIK